ncbi:hypothetical protein FRB95_000337 [Tulasnella sp. JGI-2019a]|nr:hypothetical protein FRB95_000337 [Tulasnella sp. JGI-2019a]
MLLKEIEVWSRLRHPHVLQFLGASVTASPPFIASQYMPNGDLKKYLTRNPNANRVQLIHEIALGMLYIHGKNIVHGDLKRVNVLIDDSLKARIADFGLSEIRHHATSSLAKQGSGGPLAGAGTLRYMSPEALQGYIDKASDVYAFAMTVYEIFTNFPPFFLLQDAVIPHFICEKKKRLTRPTDRATINRGLNDALWALVWNTSEPEVADRPDFNTICEVTQRLVDDRHRELKQGGVVPEAERPTDIFDLPVIDRDTTATGAIEKEERETEGWSLNGTELSWTKIQYHDFDNPSNIGSHQEDAENALLRSVSPTKQPSPEGKSSFKKGSALFSRPSFKFKFKPSGKDKSIDKSHIQSPIDFKHVAYIGFTSNLELLSIGVDSSWASVLSDIRRYRILEQPVMSNEGFSKRLSKMVKEEKIKKAKARMKTSVPGVGQLPTSRNTPTPSTPNAVEQARGKCQLRSSSVPRRGQVIHRQSGSVEFVAATPSPSRPSFSPENLATIPQASVLPVSTPTSLPLARVVVPLGSSLPVPPPWRGRTTSAPAPAPTPPPPMRGVTRPTPPSQPPGMHKQGDRDGENALKVQNTAESCITGLLAANEPQRDAFPKMGSIDLTSLMQICGPASTKKGAKKAAMMLQDAFQTGETAPMFEAAQLWRIMLANCKAPFIQYSTSKIFMDSVEDCVRGPATPPAVRELLLLTIEEAASQDRIEYLGFLALWTKVQNLRASIHGGPCDPRNLICHVGPATSGSEGGELVVPPTCTVDRTRLLLEIQGKGIQMLRRTGLRDVLPSSEPGTSAAM